MKDRIKNLLQEILIKIYEINENTKYDVIFSFSGPSRSVYVHYFLKDEIHTLGYAYLDFANAIEKLEEILEKLNELEEK